MMNCMVARMDHTAKMAARNGAKISSGRQPAWKAELSVQHMGQPPAGRRWILSSFYAESALQKCCG